MFQQPTNTTSVLTEKPSLDTVKSVITTVLSYDPSVDRKSASEWLDALRNSVYSWEICDQLLSCNDSIQVSYIAANMLRQKIARNFNELPLEYYSSLKDSILNHLQATEDYAVQGQLTMAIADLTLLLQAWQNPIEDLAKHLGLDVGLIPLVNADYVAIYKALHNRLLFAYIMHQMCDLNHNSSERPFRIGAKRREEFEDYLISKCSQSITWWLNTLKEANELKVQLTLAKGSVNVINLENNETPLVKSLATIEKLIGQIYLCYSAWLRIFDEENVNQSLPLLDAAFEHLRDPECSDTVHKYAVEVVTSTSCYCEDHRNVDYLTNHLVACIFTLEPTYIKAVTNEDTEKSGNFVKAFTNVAETACLTHVIINRDFKLVELLLNCLGHYDFEIVEDTYPFWWAFLEHLQNRLKQAEYEPFIVYINRFVMSVTKLCQFDPDEDSVIPNDQDIHAFRANTAELISNVMFVTTVEDFLRDNPVLNNLKLDLSKVSWEKVEAILYLLSCHVQMMTKDENNLRVDILHGILTQQTKMDMQTLLATKQVPLRIGVSAGEIHPQLVATSLRIIGSLENFLADYPDYLALAINYVLSSIDNPSYRAQLIKYAATTLCNIMELNANRHFSSCPELLVIVKDLCTRLDDFNEHASNELMRCSAIMADAITDLNIKDQFLCEVIVPSINSLKSILSAPKGDEVDMIKYLDRMSVLFRHTSLHPSMIPELKNFNRLADTELWSVLIQVLEVYGSIKGFAIEKSCRTLRYLIRFLKPEWMIQRVADTMVKLYQTYPQNSSPLYICSILVDEFANRSSEINQGLFNMLELFCTMTFTLLNMNASSSQSLLTMRSYPETIDDMMRLFNRFLRKCPNEFFNCKAIESIIELAISSLRIDHPDANLNVVKFIVQFIRTGELYQEHPSINGAIRNVLGARITDATIRACLLDIPSNLIKDEVEILVALHSFDKDLFKTWIEATVSALPKTNIQGIESVTEDQLEDLKKTITSASSDKKMVNCLFAFARLYT